MNRTSLLRTIYRINAFATLACGLALLFAGHLLAPVFAAPRPVLWALGALFAVFAAWIWGISRRPALLPAEATAAGILDAGYALASFAAVVLDGEAMTVELRAAILLVAAPVALFAAVELSSVAALRGAVRVDAHRA